MVGKLKKRKRLRCHGFLARASENGGQKVLAARRRKGRHSLAVSYPNRVKFTNGKSRMHIVAGGTARVVRLDGSNEKLRA